MSKLLPDDREPEEAKSKQRPSCTEQYSAAPSTDGAL